MRIRPYESRDREQILAMQAAQARKWYGGQSQIQTMDPEDPACFFVLVLEDDDGGIAAVLGAKKTVEIVMTMAPEGRDLAHFYRKQLIPLWAKTIAALDRAAIAEAVAFVPQVIKRWGFTLVKRGGWKHEAFEAFRFDVRQAVKKNVRK